MEQHFGDVIDTLGEDTRQIYRSGIEKELLTRQGTE